MARGEGCGLNFGGEKARMMSRRARASHDRMVDRFADNLADGFSVKDAASMVGQKVSWGNNTLAHIKRGLGPQAC